MATPPPPPRQTGNAEEDILSIAQWANAFYKAVVLEGEYAKANQVLGALADLPEDFDTADLTDPASATVATAQQTANDGYLLGLQAIELITSLRADLDEGTFTISNVETSKVVDLNADQEDDGYQVVITPRSYTGSPVGDAFLITGITPAIDSFTVAVAGAPGAATSVTYGWVIYRRA